MTGELSAPVYFRSASKILTITYRKRSGRLLLMAATPRIALEIFIFVVVAHPVHDTILVSSFRGEVEVVVRADEDVAAPGIAGISVENVTCPVFVEHTCSGRFGAFVMFGIFKIIIDSPVLQLLLSERHMVIVVEIAAVGRNPVEFPAHPFFESEEFFQRRPGNDYHRNVVMLQMEIGAIDVVGQERAARATFFPFRVKHEMVDDELTFAIKRSENHSFPSVPSKI
jgi:hypothetical protein